MLIKNGVVLHYDRLEAGRDVRVAGERIAFVGSGLTPEAGERVLDATGCYVLPGLIDLHNHGLRHLMAQYDGLVEYSQLLAAEGVTACVPTLLGSPRENVEVMQRGLAESDGFRRTPNLVGFRPEITYLAKTGAGSADSLTRITAETTEALYQAAQGTIRIWDISPELDGAVPFVRWCRERGIVTSLAHSSATIEETRRAVDAGLCLVTHFYDTFDPPPQTDAGVYPTGLTDYIQVEDRLTVEIIPDGVHVHPYLLEKTFRCKGLERIVFITDGVKGAGNPPGVYDGLYPGVQVEVTADRGVRRTSDDALSGSALTHIQGFRNAMLKFGKSLVAASILCSRTPARVLGMTHKGYLAAGMDADIIIVTRDFDLGATIARGELLYQV
ncbi:MAG: amidohydrolase family protein [Chloroflexi bacterium]|nr:amidohydrolase family protein [Chloroflexota bacterium]